MPDISNLSGSTRDRRNPWWSKDTESQEYGRTRPPVRPPQDALCSHVWDRTQTLTANQTLRIRNAIPHGDTERTDNLDSTEWGHFVVEIEECRPSVISICQELGIMMGAFPGCPENQSRIQYLTTATQVTARDSLQDHFGVRAHPRIPSPVRQLELAQDMSVLEGQETTLLESYHQHLRGLELQYEFSQRRGATMVWDRPGEVVGGGALTLASIYNGLSRLVHQTIYVDPPTQVTSAGTGEGERRRRRA